MIDEAQHRAAKAIGFLYLFLMAVGFFAQLYVPARLIDTDNIVETAGAITASEGLFRASIVGDLVCFAGDAALAVAYVVLLRPVSRGLALLAGFWRLVQATILAGLTLLGVVAVDLARGDDDLTAIPREQLHALLAAVLQARADGFSIGLVFLALGSLVFSYLLLRSGYVPQAIAIWGIFATSVMLLANVAVVLGLGVADVAVPASYVAMFVFEVGTGGWLLAKGIRVPLATPA